MALNGMWSEPESRAAQDGAPPLSVAAETRSTTGWAAAGEGKAQRWTLGEMVGRSPAMERLFLQMRYLAGHLRCALIEGERGTGKELVARTLHRLGPARELAFVAASAEAFFAGDPAAGELARARGGTLYLSGVDRLQPEQQGRLLHLLAFKEQNRAGRPGYAEVRPSAATSVAALAMPRAILLSTDRPLRPLVLQGRFRSDLQQQLSSVLLALPPLRERRADIPLLVEHFAAACSRESGKRVRGISQELLTHLQAQPWTGNVAELQAVILDAVLRSEGEWLRTGDLPARSTVVGRSGSRPPSGHVRPREARPAPQTGTPLAHSPVEGSTRASAPAVPAVTQEARESRPAELLDDPNLDRAILRHIHRVLASVGGNKLRAAKLLGISRSTLYRLLDAEPASGGDYSR